MEINFLDSGRIFGGLGRRHLDIPSRFACQLLVHERQRKVYRSGASQRE